MLTLQEATTIALDVLEKESRRLETGDFLYAFGGNGPIVVMHDGSVHRLGTAKNSDATVAEFEQEHGL